VKRGDRVRIVSNTFAPRIPRGTEGVLGHTPGDGAVELYYFHPGHPRSSGYGYPCAAWELEPVTPGSLPPLAVELAAGNTRRTQPHYQEVRP
jgi:hypothetical protein